MFLAECSSIGPKPMPRDRFDYSSAISDSWKRHALLNIIKLRYFDPPISVDGGRSWRAPALPKVGKLFAKSD